MHRRASIRMRARVALPIATGRTNLKHRQDKVMDLLEKHGRSLHRLVARLTRCEHATHDLMQELFIKLRSSRGLDDADSPYAYAWRTATNLAFDWRRRQRFKLQRLEGDGYADRSEASVLGRMVQAERLERILDATSKLGELGRNAVIMRFVEQESYEQIGLRLGKNPDHIRSLCSKSLARLREILAESDDSLRDKEVSHG